MGPHGSHAPLGLNVHRDPYQVSPGQTTFPEIFTPPRDSAEGADLRGVLAVCQSNVPEWQSPQPIKKLPIAVPHLSGLLQKVS